MFSKPGIALVGEAATGSEAVERVRELRPDVVLMDIRMPDLDGLEATAIVKEEAPSTSVIIMTSHESKDHLRRAIEAGAAGFILKGMSRDALVEAVKLVKGGGSIIDTKLLAELLQDMGAGESHFRSDSEGDLGALSPREQEVLQQLAAGLTNKEIAVQIHCSVGTVKNVVQRIIEKLGVSDRTQAAVLAVRAGLLAN
jgi:RNA polymerase sigma factor (sigma-70 family)